MTRHPFNSFFKHLFPFPQPFPRGGASKPGYVFGIDFCLVQYFSFRTFDQGVLPFMCILQLSLAKRVVFLPLAVWRPNPPRFFGFVTLLQLTQCIFLAWSMDPQRKFLFTQSIPSKILLGNKLLCITYAGIMDEEDWMSTILPAMDKRFAFQPASFFLTLSRTKEKSCLWLPGCLSGNLNTYPN